MCREVRIGEFTAKMSKLTRARFAQNCASGVGKRSHQAATPGSNRTRVLYRRLRSDVRNALFVRAERLEKR
jgi:hypothetical protein